jgi:hypothetical protein
MYAGNTDKKPTMNIAIMSIAKLNSSVKLNLKVRLIMRNINHPQFRLYAFIYHWLHRINKFCFHKNLPHSPRYNTIIKWTLTAYW